MVQSSLRLFFFHSEVLSTLRSEALGEEFELAEDTALEGDAPVMTNEETLDPVVSILEFSASTKDSSSLASAFTPSWAARLLTRETENLGSVS